MTNLNLIEGYATSDATAQYAQQHALTTGEGHFSDFIKECIKLSSIGVGTFPGEANADVDEKISRIVSTALQNGINVIDTAAHYRYGRSLAAVGAGVRHAIASGVARDAMFIVSKGGFLTLRGGQPDDFNAWFEKNIKARNLGSEQDLVNDIHLLTPEHIDYQIELSRSLIGVKTLDAFLIDQPEIHIPVIGKEALNKKLLPVFAQLERAVAEGRIRYYGISTYYGFRVETDDPLFQSLTSLLGLAEKAANEVSGNHSGKHHFRLVQMPFNQVMTEAFTRFSHATGHGNIASTLQAAYQLKLFVMASHTLFKGNLADQCLDVVQQTMSFLPNNAQRAIQFNRSTPGIGATLVGVSNLAHLDDLIAVSKLSPLKKEHYNRMYQRAE